MDDATRAELAELRRRAFGPDPDIADDPRAMDRLVELERLVLSEHASALHDGRETEDVAYLGEQEGSGGGIRFSDSRIDEEGGMPAPIAVATLEPTRQDDAAGAQPPERARGTRGGIALIAALIATVAVAVTAVTPPSPSSVEVVAETSRSAFTFARDRDAEVLIHVPIDGWYGVDVSAPAPEDIPAFPASGPVVWASNLGEYYGWQLWIGGADGALQDEQCILVLRGSSAKGRCVVARLRAQSALVVSLPYLAVEASERPDRLVPGRRLGFWWSEDDVITVLLGNSPEER